jgi:hypothetical protein
MDSMPEERTQRTWTREEVEREERAQRARVRRDAARGVSRNLEDAVAHTEFARRFAEAFRPDRSVTERRSRGESVDPSR